MMCQLNVQMEKGGYYDVEMKVWMQKGGIMMCKLNAQIKKAGHYDVQMKRWI